MWADKYNIRKGQYVTLSWEAGNNLTSCDARAVPFNWWWSVGWQVNPDGTCSGSQSVYDLEQTTTFYLTVTNSAGQSKEDYVTVTVSEPLEVSVDLKCGTEPDYCEVPQPSGANLNWTIKNANCYTRYDYARWGYDADGNYLLGPWYNEGIWRNTLQGDWKGNMTVKPYEGGDFWIDAYQLDDYYSGGECYYYAYQAWADDYVNVSVIPPPVPQIYANPDCIFSNGSTTLDYGVDVYDYPVQTTCTASASPANTQWQGTVLTVPKGSGGYYSAQKTITNLTKQTTFKITCTATGYGSNSAEQTVTISPANTYSCFSDTGCKLDPCGYYSSLSACQQQCKPRCVGPDKCSYNDSSYYKECPNGNSDCPAKFSCSPYQGCIAGLTGDYDSRENCEQKCKKRCTRANYCGGYNTDTSNPECMSNSDCKKCITSGTNKGTCSPSGTGAWCKGNEECQSLLPCTITISAQPKSILLGRSATLRWTPTNCYSCKTTTFYNGNFIPSDDPDYIDGWNTEIWISTTTPPTFNLNETHNTSVKPTKTGDYTYQIECFKEDGTLSTPPKAQATVKVLLTPFWREIIPFLPGFLRGLFNY